MVQDASTILQYLINTARKLGDNKGMEAIVYWLIIFALGVLVLIVRRFRAGMETAICGNCHRKGHYTVRHMCMVCDKHIEDYAIFYKQQYFHEACHTKLRKQQALQAARREFRH